MFAVFLPALNFRGNRSPYLWWFYKLSSALGDQAGYICGSEYFLDPAELLAGGRQEAGDDLAQLYGYRVPDQATLEGRLRVEIPMQVWNSLEEKYPSNPDAAFRHYCLHQDASLHEAIIQALDQFGVQAGRPEAIISCVNCATLKAICHDKGIPLLHLELGPLRSPYFLQTVYFDFSGVNGATESRHRFAAMNAPQPELVTDPSLEELCHLFMVQGHDEPGNPDIDLGVALQIEDDSNMLCYANGHSSLSLISHARYLLFKQRITPPVLVRAHPSSFFALRSLPTGLRRDTSPTSVEFANLCKQILTINSGLAVEALLLGRAATVLGDCPFSYCIDSETGRCHTSAFAFFLLNYLVPWKIAFTPEYIRWRLGAPSEGEIRQQHMENYMQDKIQLLEQRVAELEGQLAEMKMSFSWRLTYPLRALLGFMRRMAGARSD